MQRSGRLNGLLGRRRRQRRRVDRMGRSNRRRGEQHVAERIETERNNGAALRVVETRRCDPGARPVERYGGRRITDATRALVKRSFELRATHVERTNLEKADAVSNDELGHAAPAALAPRCDDDDRCSATIRWHEPRLVPGDRIADRARDVATLGYGDAS